MLRKDEGLPWKDYEAFWDDISPSIEDDERVEVEKCYPRLDRLVRAARKKDFANTLHQYGRNRFTELSAGAIVDFIHTEVYLARAEA